MVDIEVVSIKEVVLVFEWKYNDDDDDDGIGFGWIRLSLDFHSQFRVVYLINSYLFGLNLKYQTFQMINTTI